jgi:membrane-bound lytic murein transglycosylase B
MAWSNPSPCGDVKDVARRGVVIAIGLALAMSTVLGCAKRPRRPTARSRAASVPPATASAQLLSGDRGWEWLKSKLVADGVPRQQVDRAFADSRMPAFDGLTFSPYSPKEGGHMYRDFLGPVGTQQARDCRVEWAADLERAERRFGVSASVCAAIMTVETRCGRNTGRSIVLYRVARLAMAGEPNNFQYNVRKWGGDEDADIERRLQTRARYLEDTFYPEVRAVFAIAQRERIDPLSIRGSGAGAFGFPQFLPTSYLNHAADGNGDGKISLYDSADAAASCANYLARNGWHRGLSYQEQRAVIWRYNRSDAYIDTVLTLAQRIDQGS